MADVAYERLKLLLVKMLPPGITGLFIDIPSWKESLAICVGTVFVSTSACPVVMDEGAMTQVVPGQGPEFLVGQDFVEATGDFKLIGYLTTDDLRIVVREIDGASVIITQFGREKIRA